MRRLGSGKWREFSSPTHQPADIRELVLQSSRLGNDDHQSTHKLSKSLKVYNSQVIFCQVVQIPFGNDN